MPTYDYRCEACGHEFELFQQMSAAVETTCPECGEESLRRLVGTGGAILFKGSGFYETDYRSASYKKAADSERKSNDSDKKDSSTSESKSESKPGSSSTGSGGSESKGGSGDSGGAGGSSGTSSGSSGD